jgi:transcriptional regulator with XRE-family HTH domain
MGKAETAREAGGNRTPEQASGFTLRKTRLKRGLSQQALADKGGYHRTYIGLLEGGQKSPSLRTLFNIAVTPQVQPSRILESVERLLNRTERTRAGSADRRFCGPRLFLILKGSRGSGSQSRVRGSAEVRTQSMVMPPLYVQSDS